MEPRFLEHLRCPRCQRLGTLVDRASALSCMGCAAAVGTVDGIPDFARHVPLRPEGFIPRLMDASPFVAFYERPIWRPFLASLGSGLPAEAEVEGILDLIGEPAAERGLILDLCCGTGHYARALSARFPGRSVLGVDLAPNMLQEARKKARGVAAIDFIRGDLLALPLAPGAADVVNCGGALHLFPDIQGALKAIAGALRPGGVFAAMSVAYAPGPLRHLQAAMVERGKATFFDVPTLAQDLQALGFVDFEYRLNRVSLLFKAVMGHPPSEHPAP